MAKVLGILGGLGPLASAHFLEKLTRMTEAETDQAHLEILYHSVPTLPDRTAYLLNRQAESPVPGLIVRCRSLAYQGAGVLAIPCMTCHCFYDELSRAVSVPIVNGVEETARCLHARGFERVGVLATEGSVRTGLFARALEREGIAALFPAHQERVTELIYGCLKAGSRPNPYLFSSLRDDLRKQGAQAILLGCTELSLLADFFPVGEDTVDAADILAAAAIAACGGQLRPEYQMLLAGR